MKHGELLITSVLLCCCISTVAFLGVMAKVHLLTDKTKQR